MGICKLPRIDMYWSKHHLLTPGLSSIMSLTRFKQIWRFLHPNDSSAFVPHRRPGWDPLFKSTKWGIKVFVSADANVYRFQIYTGKNASLDSDVGLCSRVVLELVDGLEHTGPSIFMDNYYTSPWLFLKLYDSGVNACGTARKTRKFYPSELDVTAKDVKSGYYDFRSRGPLLACVWKDKRIIHFLTTMHMAEPPDGEATVLRRRSNDGRRVSVTCPPCLIDYHELMRGIDHGDHNIMMGYYNIGRRSVKWWKRGYSYILEVCFFNAYTLEQHGRVGSDKRDYLAFRIDLAEGLIGSFASRMRSAGRPRSSTTEPEVRLDSLIYLLRKV